MGEKGADPYQESRKIVMLLSAIGPEELERYSHSEWVVRVMHWRTKTHEQVLAKFKKLTGMKRLVFTRFQFWDHM